MCIDFLLAYFFGGVARRAVRPAGPAPCQQQQAIGKGRVLTQHAGPPAGAGQAKASSRPQAAAVRPAHPSACCCSAQPSDSCCVTRLGGPGLLATGRPGRADCSIVRPVAWPVLLSDSSLSHRKCGADFRHPWLVFSLPLNIKLNQWTQVFLKYEGYSQNGRLRSIFVCQRHLNWARKTGQRTDT